MAKPGLAMKFSWLLAKRSFHYNKCQVVTGKAWERDWFGLSESYSVWTISRALNFQVSWSREVLLGIEIHCLSDLSDNFSIFCLHLLISRYHLMSEFFHLLYLIAIHYTSNKNMWDILYLMVCRTRRLNHNFPHLPGSD